MGAIVTPACGCRSERTDSRLSSVVDGWEPPHSKANAFSLSS